MCRIEERRYGRVIEKSIDQEVPRREGMGGLTRKCLRFRVMGKKITKKLEEMVMKMKKKDKKRKREKTKSK